MFGYVELKRKFFYEELLREKSFTALIFSKVGIFKCLTYIKKEGGKLA